MRLRFWRVMSIAAVLTMVFSADPAMAQTAATASRSMRVLHDLQYYTGPDEGSEIQESVA